MSCHRRPDVRAFLDTVDPIVGVEFGETEWHTLRSMVGEIEERPLSRARVNAADALATAERLGRSMKLLPEQQVYLYGMVGMAPPLRGTLDCFDYMAINGVVQTIDAVLAVCGPTLVRDFLGRHMTLDGMWLIERVVGEQVGTADGWQVTSPREPDRPRLTYPTLTEARRFVKEEPAAPYMGARRVENSTLIVTLICRYRHINNLASGHAGFDACPDCGDDLTTFPITRYNAIPTLTPEQIDAYFAEQADEET